MSFILDRQLLFTADQSISTIAMIILDNFTKSWDSLKVQLNHMAMINGLQLLQINGFRKRMHK